MTYRDTVVGAWNGNVLFSALVELTYRCNLDCFFCYNDLALSGRPMELADYERLFEGLSELGCLHLTLTGGEPLAHPRFFEIGAKARELGFVLRLKSNGHALRGRTLERLKQEVDPFIVEVSLHGARAETHDRQTRVPGSFERLLENLAAMKDAGLRLQINSTLTRWNESEIEAMYELADRLGIVLAFDPAVSPRDDGDLEPCSIAASPEGVARLLEARTRRAAPPVGLQGHAELPAVDSSKHCGAGSSGVAVDPYGNVYPCVQWRRPVGNLHETTIREIWTGDSGLETVRTLTVEAKKQLSGSGSEGLVFCPGASEKRTGSPLPGGLPLHPSHVV